MPRVTLTWSKTKREHGLESVLEITVKYNSKDESIKLVSIVSQERKYLESGNSIAFSGLTTRHDVTDLMVEAFPAIEREIEKIDWEEVYREYRADNIGEFIEDFEPGYYEDSLNRDR